MPLLLNFLTLLLTRAPDLAAVVRGPFMEVGGTDADFDAILAANQKDIDRLGNPDQFRHKPPVT